MLSEKTVLVLGAGASLAFGFPLGAGLKDILANKLDIRFDDWGSKLERGSYTIVEAIRELVRPDAHLRNDISSYTGAAREIADAMPMCSSIDDYIERHSGHGEYDRCAKLGIAEAILEAERGSPLRLDPRRSDTVNLSGLSDSWLSRFLQLITRGLHRDSVAESFDNLRVIIFNYDRCFEQFTYYWLQQVYKISASESASIVSKIEIVHPYGSLGSLFPESPNTIPFGGEVYPSRLIEISNKLRTYSESKRDDEKSDPLKEYIQDCRNFVFLGFAFHQQNLNLLKYGDDSFSIVRNVYASTVGIPTPRWDVILSRLSRTLNTPRSDLRPFTDNVSCERLLDEYFDNIAG